MTSSGNSGEAASSTGNESVAQVRELLAALNDAVPHGRSHAVHESSQAIVQYPALELVRLGDLVPRQQLLATELQQPRFNRIATDIKAVKRPSIFGFALAGGAVGTIAVAGSVFLTQSAVPSKGTDLAGLRSPGNVDRTVLDQPRLAAITILARNGTVNLASIDIPPPVYEDGTIAFAWIKHLPVDAKVTQGLSVAPGIWVLSMSQLRGLQIHLAEPRATPLKLSMEFLRKDGSLAAAIEPIIQPDNFNAPPGETRPP